MTTLNNMNLALSDYVLHIMSCTLLTYEETNNYKIVQYLASIVSYIYNWYFKDYI